jgi:nucleotide-binding universal stress UspA family protein
MTAASLEIQRIVVGIDFSPASVEAAQWAVRHVAPGAELVLVHAISLPEPPPIMRGRFPRRELLIDTLRAGAEKRLREISLTLGAERVWLEIREGDPVGCLTRLADDFSADLVIAGAHGERAGVLEGLGSTAEHLVRTCTRPVLLVTRPRPTSPSHVLLPLDALETEGEALRWAAGLSRRFNARVTAMHVVASHHIARLAFNAAAIVSGTGMDLTGSFDAQQSADLWLEHAVAAGVPRERAGGEVANGDPAAEILAAVNRLGVDLVVMGRPKAGGVRRAVLGSVVGGVLHRATCPVLVVPELT